jgi:hypothetical protein
MKNNARFINTEKIEGYVYSTGSNFNQLSERVTGENSKNPGTKYIAGDLDIAVDEAGLNVVTVHYTYVTETYAKSGQANNTYTALKRIIDNPNKTWINGGKDNAFKVQCTGVAIAVNDFIAADGTKVAALRNENGFCSIVSELGPENERNTFNADMLITKVTHIDADPEKNINEDYATVSGAIFGYGRTPVILPVSFTVRNEMGINYFEGLDASPSNPVFTKLWGRINCMTIKTERTEESAFGEAAVQTYERKSREYVITGTAKVPYDFGDEEVLTAADVNKMTQDRQVMLAEVEKRFNDRQASKTAGAGFASAATKATAAIPEGGFVF